MAATKGKAKGKRTAGIRTVGAAATAPAAHSAAGRKVAAGPLAVGDRVRVLAGEWGNARGAVESISGGTAVVKLEGERRPAMPREFELANLTRAHGHFDR